MQGVSSCSGSARGVLAFLGICKCKGGRASGLDHSEEPRLGMKHDPVVVGCLSASCPRGGSACHQAHVQPVALRGLPEDKRERLSPVGRNLLRPGFVFPGKVLVEKVGKPLRLSAYFRVGKLHVVLRVSTGQQRNREWCPVPWGRWPRVVLPTGTPAEQLPRVPSSYREGCRSGFGASSGAAVVCVMF